MKILLLGLGKRPHFDLPPHYAESYVRTVPGYEIITFGYNDGVDIKIDIDDDFEKVIQQLPEGWKPDFCLMYNLVQNLWPRGIDKAPFPTIYLSLDWDYHVDVAKTNVQAVDLQLVGGEYGKEHLEKLGANHAAAFYDCNIMEEYFPEKPLPIKERPFDLLYTANVTDPGDQGYDRMRWVYRLCDLADKHKVKVYIAHHFPTYESYLTALQQSKMALSFNRDGHMSFRVLEAGSQGTVILDTGEQIKKWFEPGKEFIPVNEENFFQHVTHYLSDIAGLQEMSDRFLEKIKVDFESRVHFVKIIEKAASILKNQPLVRQYSSLPDYEKHIRRGEYLYYLFFRGAQGGYFPGSEKRFFALSQKEFRQAIAIKNTPKLQLNLAITMASEAVLSQSPTELKEKMNPAIHLLEELIRTNPNYALAHYNLAHFYLRMGLIQKAYDTFQSAVTWLQSPAGEPDEWALTIREHDFEKSKIQISRQLDDYLWQLVRGEMEEARENIRKLFLGAAMYYLGVLEEENGFLTKALKSYGQSIQYYSQAPLVTVRAARLAALLGQNDQSVRFYQKSLELAPFDMNVRFGFIRLLHFLGMKEICVSQIKEALKIAKTVVVLQRDLPNLKEIIDQINSTSAITQNQFKEKLIREWIDKISRFFQANPNDNDILLRLIDLWSQLGRIDRGLDLIEDFVQRNQTMNNSTSTFVRTVYTSLNEKLEQHNNWLHARLEKINRELV